MNDKYTQLDFHVIREWRPWFRWSERNSFANFHPTIAHFPIPFLLRLIGINGGSPRETEIGKKWMECCFPLTLFNKLFFIIEIYLCWTACASVASSERMLYNYTYFSVYSFYNRQQLFELWVTTFTVHCSGRKLKKEIKCRCGAERCNSNRRTFAFTQCERKSWMFILTAAAKSNASDPIS